MNPPNKEVTSSQLPVSGSEQAPLPSVDDVGEGLRSGAERPVAAEHAPRPSTTPSSAVPPLSTIPLPELPQPVLSTTPSVDNTAATVQNSALPADDNDLIEKEWVNRAKQIVERTRDDPYKQSEDLTIFKADYLKKRYGKTIKVSQ